MNRIFVAAVAAFALLVGLGVLLGSWYTIDERERGVILRNGKVTGIATPGLGFKVPLIDKVVEISLETFKTRFERTLSYSADQQTAELTFSVNWRASESGVVDVYRQFGGVTGLSERVILPGVLEASKTVFGRNTAVTAIQNRAALNTAIEDAVRAALKDTPVIVEGVQVENIDFSDAYERSVEQSMLAEVEVQRIRQNAEREKVSAEITVTQAEAQARAKLAAARAEADAIKLRGDAEATAIRARGEALRDNPALVNLVQAERWDGRLPATMVPGGALPMLALGGPR